MHGVADSMHVVDATRPVASQGMAQGLWFAGSPKGITLNLFNQAVDSLQSFAADFAPHHRRCSGWR
jgi:hypothetical protein